MTGAAAGTIDLKLEVVPGSERHTSGPAPGPGAELPR